MEIAKRLHYCRFGITYDIKLYDSIDDVGQDRISFYVDDIQCYAPIGDIGDFRASHLRVHVGTTTYSIFSHGRLDLPAGTVAIFETSCPSGWVRESGLDGYYIMGSSTPNQTGSGSHTHNATIPGGTASTVTPPATGFLSQVLSPVKVSWPQISEGGDGTHNHTFNQTTQPSLTALNTPSFITVIFCRKT